jgi:predicted ATPase
MPITGGFLLGRDAELQQLDDAWTNPSINILTLVAWGGVGKSTLVNHWLRRMARNGYRGAARVYAWSFYHQGTVDRVTAADEFIASSLVWFGDPDPHRGTARDKGERLAKLIQQHRTLLIFDGLEPLQLPPGPQEGRLVDSGLHALLCELAAMNPGLCIITTRLPVTDLADFHDVHHHINLKCLPPADGARLLRAHNIHGNARELEQASEDFGGHCLALTLLANYLNDAFEGNILYRQQVNALQEDIRQGGHAKRVLSSYSDWIDDTAALEVLRVMGLFDRPAGAHAMQALRAFPIRDLTEHISQLTDEECHRVVSRLRRVGLLAERDPHWPNTLDTHPLVRQFFREQLQEHFPHAWRQGNECLFNHFKNWGAQYPATLPEMEVLFQAIVFGCNAGLHHQALHEVYFPRVMRGRDYYAANVLGVRGTLVSILSHFFEGGSWDTPIEPGPEQEGLEPRDQLAVLEHVRMFLTATMGYTPPGIVPCYQRIKALCYALGETRSLYSVLTSDWMHCLVTAPLAVTLSKAEEILNLARQQHDAAMLIGAYRSLSDVTYFMGNFRLAKSFAEQGVALWDSSAMASSVEEVSAPGVTCMCFDALALWQMGYPDKSLQRIQEAVAQATALANAHSLAVALHFEGYVSHFCGFPARAADVAQQLVDLSLANGFRFWLAGAYVQLGWARTLLGAPEDGLTLIAQGIDEWRATGAELIVPYWLAMSVEAHMRAGKMAECLPLLEAACESADSRGELWWKADLFRLTGLYCMTRHSDAQGERWLRRALELARQQDSVSLALRAAVNLGNLLSTQGATAMARSLVEPLYQAMSHALPTADLQSALELLTT